jgi:hypothetical protein
MKSMLTDSDYFAIGSLHVKIHACEVFLKSALDFGLSSKTHGSSTAQKLTLGQLIAALKKKVEVHQALKDLLSRFLQSRNDFAHNISKIPGVDFGTEQGVNNLRGFLESLDEDTDVVLNVFAAVMYRWQKLNFPDFESEPEAKQILDKTFALHGPNLDQYFSIRSEVLEPKKNSNKKKKR